MKENKEKEKKKRDRVVDGLAAKELVEEKGRSDRIGRPILYGTTDKFLKHFGFKSLKELPDIEDIEAAMEADAPEDELEMQQISIDL